MRLRSATIGVGGVLSAFLVSAASAAPGEVTPSPHLSAAMRARIEQEAARLNQAQEFAFFIVEDPASQRYVQFGNSEGGGNVLDLPLVQAMDGTRGPIRDAACGLKPTSAAPAEREKTLLAGDTLARMLTVLDRRKVIHHTVYCLLEDEDGLRHGYTKTVRAKLTEPSTIADLVEEVLRDAYGVVHLEQLRMTTDEGPVKLSR